MIKNLHGEIFDLPFRFYAVSNNDNGSEYYSFSVSFGCTIIASATCL